MPTIAVDAMGGEHAPDQIVEGIARLSAESDIEFILVGDERLLQDRLDGHPYRPEHLTVVHAPTAIGMHDDPKEALRARKDCSLLVGAALVAQGRADAIVSAGNTGACVLACEKTFRRIKGIRQTALASVFLRKVEHEGQDPFGLLLDVGATARCESEDLVQFAIMGAAYARRVSKVPAPRVALLNMGLDPGRGGDVLVAAHARLRALPDLNFVGNVEGNEILRGKADVIVCEGLLGSVVLRLLEGLTEIASDVASYAWQESIRWRVGLSMLGSGIRRLRDRSEDSRYGGSPILGFENLFIKADPRSDARAIANAVKVAAKTVRDDVPAEIGEMVAAIR